MQNANVLKFLQESLQRLFTKSPKFFKIWMLISGAFVLVTGVPEFLNLFPDVKIPDLWNEHVTIAVKWASRAALIMATLTTQSKPAGITTDGTIIKSTNEKALPFTAAVEQKSADKHEAPIVEVKPLDV